MVGSSKVNGSGPKVWNWIVLGAGGGWWESSELLDGEGEARVEMISGFFGSLLESSAGGVIPEVGESEDEFPEIASSFLL